MMSYPRGLILLATAILLAEVAEATNVKTMAPIMGWNSYNAYNCNPTQSIIESNARGLVDLGLSKLGYVYVTPDCGWMTSSRDASGQLRWNKTTFPSGGDGLGKFLHDLGLKFGLYSGGGYFQCGSKNLPASLGHEVTDANSFAAWGADSVKYDNCYSTSNTTMVDNTSSGATSPARFQTMAKAIASTSRDMVYQVCQWGVGTNIGDWASKIAGSWRISNDIQNNWRSIWRITNEVVPYFKWTGVGGYPDMDMLIVGLKVLSFEEERFHFGMWAINKSPLIIGCPINPSVTPSTSLSILANKEVIAINQDPLGEQARLVRRYTEEQYDIWAGNLSAGRKVLGLANWSNNTQTITVDLASTIGLGSTSARDIWAQKNFSVSKTYTTILAGHQLQLLVLTDIVPSTTILRPVGGYHAVSAASMSGSASISTCPQSGQCLPTGTKAVNLGPGAAISFTNITAATAGGTHVLGVDFINYDTALDSAWTWAGTNTRNMTVAVNGGPAKRWAFPISGGDWYDTGRLHIEVSGFVAGSQNQIVFRSTSPAGAGSVMAPDLVGFEVLEPIASA